MLLLSLIGGVVVVVVGGSHAIPIPAEIEESINAILNGLDWNVVEMAQNDIRVALESADWEALARNLKLMIQAALRNTHPDKGGEHEAFIRVRSAHQIIEEWLKKQWSLIVSVF